MRNRWSWGLGVLAFAVSFSAATPMAQASAVSLFAHWGTGAAVNVYLGTVGGYPVVVEENKSTLACWVTVVGPSGPLQYDIAYWATDGADYVQADNANKTRCGWTLGSVAYNGHYFGVFGKGGNDRMVGGVGTNVWFGEDGNDDLTTSSGYLSASFGDNDNDVLYGSPTSVNEGLIGGNGNDTICENSNGSKWAIQVDGGDGTDCSEVNSSSFSNVEQFGNCSACLWLQ